MVPPPKRVDAVEVHNTTSKPLTFKAYYDNHKDKTELTEESTVAAGATHTFAEKELDMGGWQAVAPIIKVTVSGGGGGEHTLTPSVGGIVKLLKVSAREAAGGLSLAQH